jgi:translation elongation factor EF-G
MAVEVTVPEEFMGVIIGDINSRRGRIEGMEHAAGSQVIKAIVPLAEVLSTSTRGRLDYPMQFVCYEEVPHGGWPGGGAGAAVHNPRIPKGGSGSAAASLDPESE